VDTLSRRQFVLGSAGAGLLAGCGRRPWQAPQPPKVYRVGFLAATPGEFTTLPSPGAVLAVDAFLEGLHEQGFVEGQNIVIEYRLTAQGPDRLRPFAEELAALPVDVIVAVSGPAVRAARAVTSSIPVVVASAGDLLAEGFIASLARPGSNISGMTLPGAGLAGKRLQLLQEAIPGVARVALLFAAETTSLQAQARETHEAAESLGLQVFSYGLRGPDPEFDRAFEAVTGERADALLTLDDAMVSLHRMRFVDFAAKRWLPWMSANRLLVNAGALMAYGSNFREQYRRAAYYVDRILRGTKPADLPVEQPTTFDFVINLKTAQALGLTIPQHVLLQATEVIQ
jgi:putative ABC transport system substrate-binding protein